MDHVNRSERGLISPGIPLPPPATKLSLVVGPVVLVVILILLRSVGRRYDDDVDDALAVLPVILFPIVLPAVVDVLDDSRMDFLLYCT